MNNSNHELISVKAEQEFWSDWISKNDDSTCPLQPFVLSFTQAGIDQFQNKIKKIKNTDSAILFIQINIDNGVFYFYYLTWSREGQFMHTLEWSGPNGEILERKIDSKEFNIRRSLDVLSCRSVFVDTDDRTSLGRDSMYLSLKYEGRYSRFAVYNPMINKKKQSELPFLLIDKLLAHPGVKKRVNVE